MKIILIAVICAMLPARSGALRRMNSPTPQLRSVLDDKQPAPFHYRTPQPAGRCATNDVYDVQPVRAVNPVEQGNDQRRRTSASPLIVAGGFLTVGGSALLLSSANGRSSQAEVTNTLFAVIAVAGLILLITGIAMNARYGRHKKAH